MAHVQMTDVSVDCVVFGFDENALELKVLLIKRGLGEGEEGNPGMYALPGNLVFEDEGLHQAAERVLNELTGLRDVYLKQFFAFGSPNRVKDLKDQEWLRAFRQDPQARVITIGYYSLIKMDSYEVQPSSFARDAEWVSLQDIPELAFDHNQILDKALSTLRFQIQHDSIGFELLPEKFTLSQLQHLNEIVLGHALDKRNFRRKVQKMESVVPLDEKQKGVLHKPARLYRYDPSLDEKSVWK